MGYLFLTAPKFKNLRGYMPQIASHEISCKKKGILQSPSAELKSPNTKRSNSSQGHFRLLACRHFKTPPRNPVVFAAIKRVSLPDSG